MIVSPSFLYRGGKASLAVDDEQGEKVLKFIDALNEHDNVQNVYANFEVSDALVAKMSA
jgi:transcriptional/translational regulatory protein YebC/TACO1